MLKISLNEMPEVYRRLEEFFQSLGAEVTSFVEVDTIDGGKVGVINPLTYRGQLATLTFDEHGYITLSTSLGGVPKNNIALIYRQMLTRNRTLIYSHYAIEDNTNQIIFVNSGSIISLLKTDGLEEWLHDWFDCFFINLNASAQPFMNKFL